ncbi:hypothetical protein [Kitasatospora sp. NPDC059673]
MTGEPLSISLADLRRSIDALLSQVESTTARTSRSPVRIRR